MFVSTEQLQIGVTNFIEAEIAKKATGTTKFLTYLAIPVVNKKVAYYMDSFFNSEFTKDMFDEERNIDIDLLYNMSKEAIRKSGQVVAYGIVFNETDIDKLYNYIAQIHNIK